VADETILNDTTLSVLAGGAGTRMGASKAILNVNGRPVLEHLLDRLKWPGRTMLVLTQGQASPAGADRFDRQVRDEAGGQGPLQGVRAALESATTSVIIVIAVDMLALRREDLAWYVSQLAASPDALGIMGTRNHTVEPLPCALRSESRELISASLAQGRRSLVGLSDDPRIRRVDADSLPSRVWANANTPAEWERLVQTLDD
jgi:molybdopterin-guanine dinucleotide biosynthesis protein A